MRWSKVREARLGLAAGRVTLPGFGRPAPERFRGRPVFDAARCTGCAGCASNCPARAILVRDTAQEVRVLEWVGRRCLSCGRCAEVCPEQAVTLGREFETAGPDPRALRARVTLFMGTCQRCGRCFRAPTPVDALKRRGFRADVLDGPAAAGRPHAPEDVVIELED